MPGPRDGAPQAILHVYQRAPFCFRVGTLALKSLERGYKREQTGLRMFSEQLRHKSRLLETRVLRLIDENEQAGLRTQLEKLITQG